MLKSLFSRSVATRRGAVLNALLCATLLPACSSEDNEDGLNIGNGGNASGAAAGSSGTPPNTGGGGGGIALPPAGGEGSGGAPSPEQCTPAVVGLLRDFRAAHPNFEESNDRQGSEKGIVAADLGADRKPVFVGGNMRTVTTAADFDQWYRDVPDVNMTFEHTITFEVGANGRAVYDSAAFFPLDGRGFGNEGGGGRQQQQHNFHFTFELHMQFRYRGGEVFTFRGDDDVFAFVNNKLAIDLGGVHSPESAELNLDEEAARLGITPGGIYALDLFHAERHTSQSNFRVETNMEFTNCEPILIR
ncbi:MAG TPA: fibro-slime domain-containing protein [Polyangiaceae bacterium]|nr:fibro-slime domain-containing protein [Polyangiaceae bacterium]